MVQPQPTVICIHILRLTVCTSMVRISPLPARWIYEPCYITGRNV